MEGRLRFWLRKSGDLAPWIFYSEQPVVSILCASRQRGPCGGRLSCTWTFTLVSPEFSECWNVDFA